MQHFINTPRKSSGFTLIEVLITIIVVSISLLGLAGLQISGLRANIVSEARSNATILANDIAERIRANQLGANQYTAITTAEQDCSEQPAPFCSNYNDGTAYGATECDPDEMATFDSWVWACGMPTAANVKPGGVTNALLNGAGSVSCDGACSPGSPHTITITWNVLNPDNSGAADTTATLTQTYSLVMVP